MAVAMRGAGGGMVPFVITASFDATQALIQIDTFVAAAQKKLSELQLPLGTTAGTPTTAPRKTSGTATQGAAHASPARARRSGREEAVTVKLQGVDQFVEATGIFRTAVTALMRAVDQMQREAVVPRGAAATPTGATLRVSDLRGLVGAPLRGSPDLALRRGPTGGRTYRSASALSEHLTPPSSATARAALRETQQMGRTLAETLQPAFKPLVSALGQLQAQMERLERTLGAPAAREAKPTISPETLPKGVFVDEQGVVHIKGSAKAVKQTYQTLHESGKYAGSQFQVHVTHPETGEVIQTITHAKKSRRPLTFQVPPQMQPWAEGVALSAADLAALQKLHQKTAYSVRTERNKLVFSELPQEQLMQMAHTMVPSHLLTGASHLTKQLQLQGRTAATRNLTFAKDLKYQLKDHVKLLEAAASLAPQIRGEYVVPSRTIIASNGVRVRFKARRFNGLSPREQVDQQIALYEQSLAESINDGAPIDPALLQKSFSFLVSKTGVQLRTPKIHFNPQTGQRMSDAEVQQLQAAANATKELSQAQDEAARSAKNMYSYIGHHLGMWAILVVGIYGVVDKFKEVIDEAARFQLEMARISQMSAGGNLNFNQTFQGMANIAVQYGASMQHVTDVMREFIAMGYNEQTSLQLTSQAMLASNISFMTAKESVDAIIGSMYQFNLQASQVPQLVNTWAAVFQSSGVPINSLVEGLDKIGEAITVLDAQTPKISNLQNAAFGTALIAEGKRSLGSGFTGSEVGNIWKYVLNNLSNQHVQEVLTQLGIPLYSARTGNMLGAPQLIQNLATYYERANPQQQALLGRILSGSGGRRAAQVDTILANYRALMPQILNHALNPGNTAVQQNQIVMNTLINSVKQFEAAFDKLAITLANPHLLGAMTKLVQLATALTSTFSGPGLGGIVGSSVMYTGALYGGVAAYRALRQMPIVGNVLGAVFGAPKRAYQAIRAIPGRGQAFQAAYAQSEGNVLQRVWSARRAAMGVATTGVEVATGAEAVAGVAAAGATLSNVLVGLAASIGPVILVFGALAAVAAMLQRNLQKSAEQSQIQQNTKWLQSLGPEGIANQIRLYRQLQAEAKAGTITSAGQKELQSLQQKLIVQHPVPKTTTLAETMAMAGAGWIPINAQTTKPIVLGTTQKPINIADMTPRQLQQWEKAHPQTATQKQLHQQSTTAQSLALLTAEEQNFNTVLQSGQSIIQVYTDRLTMMQDAYLNATQSIGYFRTAIQGMTQEMAAQQASLGATLPFFSITQGYYQKAVQQFEAQIQKQGYANFMQRVQNYLLESPAAQQADNNLSYIAYHNLLKASQSYFGNVQQISQAESAIASLAKRIQLMQASLIDATTNMPMFNEEVQQMAAAGSQAQGVYQALYPTVGNFTARLTAQGQMLGATVAQYGTTLAQLQTVQAVMRQLQAQGVSFSPNALGNPMTAQEQAAAGLVQQQAQLQQSLGTLTPQLQQQFNTMVQLQLQAKGYYGVWSDITNEMTMAGNSLRSMHQIQSQLTGNVVANNLQQQFLGPMFNAPALLNSQALQARNQYANLVQQIATAMAQYGSDTQALTNAIQMLKDPANALATFVNQMQTQVVSPEQAVAQMGVKSSNLQLQAAQTMYQAASYQIQVANAEMQNTQNLGQILANFSQVFADLAGKTLGANGVNMPQSVAAWVNGTPVGKGLSPDVAQAVDALTGANFPKGVTMDVNGNPIPELVRYGQYANGKWIPNPGTVEAWMPLIQQVVQGTNIPAALVAAIMQQESGGNPFSVSSTGDFGLMQINQSAHPNYFRNTPNPFDPLANITEGVKILANDLQAAHGDLQLALEYYNAGMLQPWAGAHYAQSVLANYQKFRSNPAFGIVATSQSVTVPTLSPVPNAPSLPPVTPLSAQQILAQATQQYQNQLQSEQLTNQLVLMMMQGQSQGAIDQMNQRIEALGGTSIPYGTVLPTSPEGQARALHNELLRLSQSWYTASPEQRQALNTEMQAVANALASVGGGKYKAWVNLANYATPLGFNSTLTNTPYGAEMLAQVQAQIQQLEAQATEFPSILQTLKTSVQAASEAFKGFGDNLDYLSSNVQAMSQAISSLQSALAQNLIPQNEIPQVSQAIQMLKQASLTATIQQSQISLQAAQQTFMGFGDSLDYASAKAQALSQVISQLQQGVAQGLFNPSQIQAISQDIHTLERLNVGTNITTIEAQLQGAAQAFLGFGDQADFAAAQLQAVNNILSALQQGLAQNAFTQGQLGQVQSLIQALKQFSVSIQFTQLQTSLQGAAQAFLGFGNQIDYASAQISTINQEISTLEQALSQNIFPASQVGTVSQLVQALQQQSVQAQTTTMFAQIQGAAEAFKTFGDYTDYASAKLQAISNEVSALEQALANNTFTGPQVGTVAGLIQSLQTQAFLTNLTQLAVNLNAANQAFMGFGDWSSYASQKLQIFSQAIQDIQQALTQGLMNPVTASRWIKSLDIQSFATQAGQNFASALASGMASAMQGQIAAPANFMDSFKQAIAQQISNVMASEVMAQPAVQSLLQTLGVSLGTTAYGYGGANQVGDYVYNQLVAGTDYFVNGISELFGGGAILSGPSPALGGVSLGGNPLWATSATLGNATTNVASIGQLLNQAMVQGFNIVNQIYSQFGPFLATLGNSTYNSPAGFKISPYLYAAAGTNSLWAPMPQSGLNPGLGLVPGATNAQGSTVNYQSGPMVTQQTLTSVPINQATTAMGQAVSTGVTPVVSSIQTLQTNLAQQTASVGQSITTGLSPIATSLQTLQAQFGTLFGNVSNNINALQSALGIQANTLQSGIVGAIQGQTSALLAGLPPEIAGALQGLFGSTNTTINQVVSQLQVFSSQTNTSLSSILSMLQQILQAMQPPKPLIPQGVSISSSYSSNLGGSGVAGTLYTASGQYTGTIGVSTLGGGTTEWVDPTGVFAVAMDLREGFTPSGVSSQELQAAQQLLSSGQFPGMGSSSAASTSYGGGGGGGYSGTAMRSGFTTVSVGGGSSASSGPSTWVGTPSDANVPHPGYVISGWQGSNPVYSRVPGAATGGEVLQSGLAYLHSGEIVVRSDVTSMLEQMAQTWQQAQLGSNRPATTVVAAPEAHFHFHGAIYGVDQLEQAVTQMLDAYWNQKAQQQRLGHLARTGR